MKSIKSFKYVDENNFGIFLYEYGYTSADVKGFSLNDKKQYRGNVLKTYEIYFNDGECKYFSVAVFESFNEYNKSYLGFNGNRMLHWYEIAIIKLYKLNDEYVLN